MIIKKKKTILAIVILILALSIVGCSEVSQEQKDEKLDVVVSIIPQKAFVKAVAGDLVNVKELIPPGGSPATYEPRPSDLASVEKADIYFRVGHIPFERSHIDKLAGLNPDMEIVDTSVNVQLRHFGEHEEHSHEDEEHEEECSENEGIWIEEHKECEGISEEICKELDGEFDACASACRNDPDAEICTKQCVLVCSFEENERDKDGEHDEDEPDHDHKGVDPHIWFSPMQVKKQVDVIAQTLAQVDPANEETYSGNAEKFKKELDALHSEIESELDRLKTGKLMVFHPALGYFADEYGLEQIAIEQSGKEPTAQDLQHIVKEAREEQIKVIFVQSQFNKEIAESIAEEVGAVVVSIDPLSEDYIDNLRNVATTIAESLNE